MPSGGKGLLAQKVLQGITRGYLNHPQLERFRSNPHTVTAVATYLRAVHEQSILCSYSFNADKIVVHPSTNSLYAWTVLFEVEHFKTELKIRSPAGFRDLLSVKEITVQPLFSPDRRKSRIVGARILERSPSIRGTKVGGPQNTRPTKYLDLWGSLFYYCHPIADR